ncbi:MAG: hypothetical protein UT81_C0002G0006 [Parcubacteria group bacterium GW2011_GWA2_40_14]|nr:MAG: hypothetical protein UT81_C0002G0006 [Parcubacteria group bacterium GW2011_GWA2_40_14]
MRKQFVKTVEEILGKNEKVVLLLGDIGVFGFRESFKLYPTRVYNIGILEQSTISVASGLSMTGLIPIIHTIAPFITERCFEQIKNDFGYQKIVVPGTAEEFDTLFKESYNNGNITYFRLSERKNQTEVKVKFGKANVIKKGKLATVIAVGPLLDKVISATLNLDVTVIYLTTLRPFDTETVRKNIVGNKVLICEPYYSGAITSNIINSSKNPLKIDLLGIPHEFLTNYGKMEEHDEYIGFTEKEIEKRVKKLIRSNE